MSISWATIEAAIHAWAVAGTGLDAANVIWGGQNTPRPDDTYVVLRGVARPVGLDWTTVEDAAVPSPGAEIDIKSQGVRELAVTVTCFGGSHRGSGSPQGLLGSMISNAHLESRRDALNIAGWVPARIDPITVIDGILGGSVFEPRSTFQCFGQVASEVSETATYIQIVKVTNLITGEISTLDTES